MVSVRKLAKDLNVSTFTVVTAYERLTSAGYLFPRRRSGYFVGEKVLDHLADPDLMNADAVDSLWLFRVLRQEEGAIQAGIGVLPPHWFDREPIKRAARVALRNLGDSFVRISWAAGISAVA